jgi:hypothetical protein
VCGIPFEAFVEMGLELKKRSPFAHTVVVGLANGRHGYLPTAEQHPWGGYETWLGTNNVQEDASRILTEHLLEMLAELDSPAVGDRVSVWKLFFAETTCPEWLSCDTFAQLDARPAISGPLRQSHHPNENTRPSPD